MLFGNNGRCHRKLLLFVVPLFFLILFAPSSFARDLQVGVSPIRIDLGEVPAGTEKYATFSLVTQASSEILVRLGAIPATRDVYTKPENARFAGISSDEAASGWINFPANPVVILPANESFRTEGGVIGGWRGAGFNIKVPNNAEPCYHAFQIKPIPYSGTSYETGVSIAAITVVTVFFKVPGECIRDGTILDIQQGAGVGENIGIDTYFKNTGTASILVKASEIRVYAENGTEMGASKSGERLIKPGEIIALPAYFSPRMLEGGKTYKAVSTVSWDTGSKTQSALLILEYTAPPAGAEQIPIPLGWRAYIPALLKLILILIILAAAYFVYKRE